MRASWRSWISRSALLCAAVAVPRRGPAQDGDLPPPGFGTLRQDEVAVRITTPNLVVRALPLDERVIRLLASDAYSSLRELVRSRARDVATAARGAGYDSAAAFVVTYFALQPDVRFNPDQLYVSSQNSFFRPIAIIPLTPRWSEYQLEQRQQAIAIYLFQPGIVLLQPFTVFYGDRSSSAWESSLRLLERERARVLSRAAQQPQP